MQCRYKEKCLLGWCTIYSLSAVIIGIIYLFWFSWSGVLKMVHYYDVHKICFDRPLIGNWSWFSHVRFYILLIVLVSWLIMCKRCSCMIFTNHYNDISPALFRYKALIGSSSCPATCGTEISASVNKVGQGRANILEIPWRHIQLQMRQPVIMLDLFCQDSVPDNLL